MKKAIILATAATFIFTGCGGGTQSDISGNYSGGYDGSSNNRLTIEKTQGKNFTITWDKKSSGYAEVIYGFDTSSRNSSNRIFTSNTTGIQTLNCQYTQNTTSAPPIGHPSSGSVEEYARYECTGSETNYTGDKKIYLPVNYEIYVSQNYTTSLNNSGIEYTLLFTDNQTLDITKN